jgi:hypothetical protein
LDTLAIHRVPQAVQIDGHATAPVKRRPGILLIKDSHQLQRLRTFFCGLVVPIGSP